MRQLHNAMIVSLITASLLAALTIAVPAIAAPAPAHRTPTAESGAPALPANRGPWRPPVAGLDLLTGFDPPPLPWLPGHRGVDLAAAGAQAVLAAGAGTVVFAGDLAGRGVVSIAHPGGLRTTYEPVEPLVATGEAVSAGQTIGTLQPGHVSCPNAACLHLGLKRGPLYLDPLLLFGAGKVRLLPRPGHTAPAAEHQRTAKSQTSAAAMPRAPEISAARLAQRIGTTP
ncbi:M23 family metallopeptidase [Glycomyces harbinensis]|uniref:Peptidase family M23 n=1 Tax=Glycomyces harbinensis TaxID=58114 RepID=A0A1G6SXM2_9ACTN|nr:M23 family metallopeptidase [Glycomyces harbinensis]SDD21491.1 Peptidase family M23 [Glycomyces harbinensis]